MKATKPWALAKAHGFHAVVPLPAGGLYKIIKPTMALIITKHNWIKGSQNYHDVYRFFDKDNNSSFADTMTIHTVELTKLKEDDVKASLYN